MISLRSERKAVCTMDQQFTFSLLTDLWLICRQLSHRWSKIAYGLSLYVGSWLRRLHGGLDGASEVDPGEVGAKFLRGVNVFVHLDRLGHFGCGFFNHLGF